jgi:glycosidase
MQWNDQPYAGFSQVKPHQKVVGNYRSINVAAQVNDPDSILSMYRTMIKLRLHSKYSNCLIYGTYKLEYEKHPTLFVYSRELEGTHLRIIANFSNQQVRFDELISLENIIVNNYETLEKNTLMPYQALVVTLEAK